MQFDEINNLPFFDKLTENEKKLLKENIKEKSFLKGTHIHSGSADCSGLIVVKEGQLRAFIISDSGKELTLYRLSEDEVCIFSASCMLKEISFDIYIDAEKDSSCLIIPVNIYQKLSENRAVADWTNELMSKRFSDVMWLIEQTLFKSFDERLASFLIDQSVMENSLKLNITHEEIARHLGSAREVVTRMLKHFQNEGLVNLSRGSIEITDNDGLFKLTEKK